MSYYKLQLYNKRTPARAILIYFWDFFQNTHKQILLFLLGHYEILLLLSKPLQYFSYYIATVAITQPYEKNNYLTFWAIRNPLQSVVWSCFVKLAYPKKIWIFIEKCQRWSPIYIKSWGNESNLSDFSRVVIL